MQERLFIVSGIVQGVGFRAATQKLARELGLVGWVKNTPSGTVEVVARGDSAGVAALRTWLKQGPSTAQVGNVQEHPCKDSRLESWNKFEIY